jgi:hypothetical protein
MTPMRWTILVVLVAALGLASPSCGGDKATSGGFTTSVPGDKPLPTLTPGEASTLCIDVARAYAGAHTQEDICRFLAYYAAVFAGSSTQAELQAACTMTRDMCLRDGGTLGPPGCEMPSADCTATVTDLGRCVNDNKKNVDQQVAMAPTCDLVTPERVAAELSNVPPTPASCITLAMKCADGGRTSMASAAGK